MKKTLRNLMVAATVFCAVGANAQVNDTVAVFKDGEITTDAIVYAKVQLNDVDGLGTYNSGITLSQDTVKVWGDYSCFIRFNNVSNAAYTENTIDLRNGGAFATPTEVVNFEMGKIYHLWFEISYTAETYNAYVQTADAAAPVKIFEGAAFRKTAPTSLKYIASLRNGGESANTMSLLEYKKTDKVGLSTTEPTTSINTFSNTAMSVYPNPAKDVVYVTNSENVAQINIFDMAGKLVMSAESAKNLNVSALNNGVYLVRMNLKDAGVSQQLLLKK